MPLPDTTELLGTLQEIQQVNTALIEQHKNLLVTGQHPGPLRRWEHRTLSALRAALKVQDNTARSIRKLKRRMGYKL